MSEELLPIRFVARQLRIPLRWLRGECEAGRVPALDAGGVFVANPDAVRAALLARISPANPSSESREVAVV